MQYEESKYKEDYVYHVYNLRFDGLTDLYEYLKSNPSVNKRIFVEQASLANDPYFYGEPLDKSIEYLIGGYERDLNNFLRINDELRKSCFEESDELIQRRGLFGGVALAPLVAAGVPDCMLRYERNQDVKVVNVYFNLSYPAYTATEAIINRGLSTIYLIQSLEEKGYVVNFYAFELSYNYNEIVNIEIKLKNASDLFFNVEKCYYPMRAKEFLRRILFRVLESIPVENDWSNGYGRPASRNFIKQFFDLDQESLIVGVPSEMGVYGENIYEDTKNLIKTLKVNDEFDMEKLSNLANKNR